MTGESGSGPLHIREAKASDAASFAAIERQFFPDYAPTSHGELSDALGFARTLKAAGAEKRLFYAAVTETGEVVGIATAKPFETTLRGRQITYQTGPLAVLSQVAVTDEYQHHGIGPALVTTVLNSLHKDGFAVVIAHIPSPLAPWYESLGFDVCPPDHGFTWMEMPGPDTAQFSPTDWTEDDRKTDTPRFVITPDGHGYDQIAMIGIGVPGSTYLGGSAFPLADSAPGIVRNASRKLLSLTLGYPGFGEQVSPGSRYSIWLEGLSDAEREAWPTGWETVRDNPFPDSA